MKKIAILIFLSLSLLHAQSRPMEGVHLKIGTSTYETGQHGEYLVILLDELSNKLGFTYDYLYIPPSRLSVMGDEGSIDGDILRISTYGDKHPNLIKVPTSYMNHRILVYCKSPEISVHSWEEIRDKGYTISIRRGVSAFEKPATLYVDEQRILRVNDDNIGIKMAGAERVDLAMISNLALDVLENSMKEAQLYLAGEIPSDTLHLYLHKTKAEYVPIIDRAIQELEEEGILEKFRPKYE
ncbi:MAG: hypothetical protein PQJ59_12710 [Spirochaetales bacterium]|nr:hypothetical protein [Spirochaetales bacterium]